MSKRTKVKLPNLGTQHLFSICDLHKACVYAYDEWGASYYGTKMEEWVKQRYKLTKAPSEHGDVHYNGLNFEIKFSSHLNYRGELHIDLDHHPDEYLLFLWDKSKCYIFKLTRQELFENLPLKQHKSDKRFRMRYTIGSLRSLGWKALQPYQVQGGIEALDAYFNLGTPIPFVPTAILFENGKARKGIDWHEFTD